VAPSRVAIIGASLASVVSDGTIDMSKHEPPREGSKDRDSNYRALVRDVLLGAVAVVFVSLAVPAWIIHSEYRKTYQAPANLTPEADVSRDPTSKTVTPPAPDIFQFAERLVRREAERREAERRETERREAERRAAAPPASQPPGPPSAKPVSPPSPSREAPFGDYPHPPASTEAP
jgi:hypothetical protein